jgi:hypothetical protein
MKKNATTTFRNEMNYENVWKAFKIFKHLKGNLGNQISSLVGKISIQTII